MVLYDSLQSAIDQFGLACVLNEIAEVCKNKSVELDHYIAHEQGSDMWERACTEIQIVARKKGLPG